MKFKYKTYDTSSGFGNTEDWKKSFENKSKVNLLSDEIPLYQWKSLKKKEGLKNCKTIEELKTEFKRLMLKHHPDRAGDTVENNNITKLIIAEYEVLLNKLKKKLKC